MKSIQPMAYEVLNIFDSY